MIPQSRKHVATKHIPDQDIYHSAAVSIFVNGGFLSKEEFLLEGRFNNEQKN